MIFNDIRLLHRSFTFDLLLDDQTNQTWYVDQCLKTLPDSVIESLIKCTLPYDYHKGDDMDLRRFVDDEMQLVATPGIYLNLPNFGKAQGELSSMVCNKQSLTFAIEGKCLSGRNLRDVLDSAELYFKDDPADQDQNSKIDAFFEGSGDIAERRWGKDETPKIIAKDWITRVKEMYLHALPDVDLDERFTRCLAQCGWGINMTLRAAAHLTNTSTTYIFAPYNVLTRMRGFPAPWQLALFPIWKKNTELCRITEILGHILCSTYWFEGGLNASWAGSFGDSSVEACMLCHPNDSTCPSN